MKGMSLFTEIANYLHKIRSRFTSAALNLRGSLTDFSGIEEMLRLERSDFEVRLSFVIIFVTLHLSSFSSSLFPYTCCLFFTPLS